MGANPFAAPGDKPGTVTYIQQRLALANTENDPQLVVMSKTAELSNFNRSNPIQDNDSIQFSIAGRQRDEVNNMLDLGKLVILTSGGEWSAEGDAAGILRPLDINLRQHSYNGSNRLAPVIVDGSALYVQARGSVIRDLGFSYQVDGYQGNDLTIFASHLFDNYSIVDWCYQQIPDSIVWAVRSDGVLLGLTLVREQQLLAWHRHTFDGKVKSITSVPGDGEDHVYLSIERIIDGRPVRHIERLSSRKVVDQKDCVFMDSAISFDGNNRDPDHKMMITTASGNDWSAGKALLLESEEDTFAYSDVGKVVVIKHKDGDLTCSILGIASMGPTLSTAIISVDKDIPEDLRNVGTSDWSRSINELSGLHHLEGRSLSVLGDGFVLGSPNNKDYAELVVDDGKISLPGFYTVVHAGLPYVSDIQTLNIDTDQGESLANKKINIQQVTAMLEKSAGGWFGAKPPKEGGGPLGGLRELKLRDEEGYNDPVNLKTGKVGITIKSEWSNGSVFIRQVDPLPLTVLSIFPAGYIPFR